MFGESHEELHPGMLQYGLWLALSAGTTYSKRGLNIPPCKALRCFSTTAYHQRSAAYKCTTETHEGVLYK